MKWIKNSRMWDQAICRLLHMLIFWCYFKCSRRHTPSHFIWSTDLGHKLELRAAFGIQNCIAIQDQRRFELVSQSNEGGLLLHVGWVKWRGVVLTRDTPALLAFVEEDSRCWGSLKSHFVVVFLRSGDGKANADGVLWAVSSMASSMTVIGLPPQRCADVCASI